MSTTSKHLIALIVVPTIALALVGNVCFAQSAKDKFETGLRNTGTAIGYVDTNPVSASQSIPKRIGDIVKILLTFLAVIFLVLIIFAGYRWMMAQGNDQQVTEAKNTIINSIIGLIIVLAAYAITAGIGIWLEGSY